MGRAHLQSHVLQELSQTLTMYTFTDAKGEEQVMSREEAVSIEASGSVRPPRNPEGLSMWVHYARAEEVRYPFKEFNEAMNARPLPVAEGTHPAEYPVQRPKKHNYNPSKVFVQHRWHLRAQFAEIGQNTACKRMGNNADVFGYRRFARLASHPNICRNCLAAYEIEREDKNGRQHVMNGRPL